MTSGALRVAVVTESFLPSLNGVTTSVCRVLEHLARGGHEALVICPGPAPESFAGHRVLSVPAVRYRRFPVGLPTPALTAALAGFTPDVVHVASPFVLGAAGLTSAARLGVPSVAVFQTDVAGFARTHGLALAAPTAWRWIKRVHERADLTLVPSAAALADLRAQGVPRLAMWGRGVDAERYRPRRRVTARVQALRSRWAPGGEVLVGYVGRVAAEKEVDRLAVLAGLPGLRLVVVGDGPARTAVERGLAAAAWVGPPPLFTGQLDGEALADAYAALDVFVHTGTRETFGQTLQEAMASGLPVVAPAAGGPLDLFTDGVEGSFYPPADDQALRARVRELATDGELRQRMGLAGRERVLPRSWSALCDDLLGHYRRVIAAHAPALAA